MRAIRNFLVLVLLAGAHLSWAKALISVKTGGTTVFDVAGTDGEVSLKYEVWTDNQSYPQVRVVSEDNGFECRVLDVNRIGFVERVSMPAQITYEIPVQWSPGADLSSCDIRIIHPDFAPTKVRLEMNY